MTRLVLVVIKLFYIIPYWILKMKYMAKNNIEIDKTYVFLQKISNKIIKSGRIKIDCTGIENIPKENGYLIISNHQGLIDPVLIIATHPNIFRAVVKKELTKTIAIKDVVKISKSLPIDRSDTRQSITVILEVVKGLKEKINYLIFPEGTRSRNGNNLLEFKAGTFKAAEKSKAPILPIAIIDCYKVFDSKGIKPVTVKIHYFPPIYYEEYKELKTFEIATKIHNLIQNYINENIKEE